ncbi:unnamed protein product [Peniophora sp. CBMAI 1063]|nr:unnamed protein product [Peniophora sp. CBMAI 1063]
MASTSAPTESLPRPANGTTFVDPKDRFWHMYLQEAQVQDKQRTDRWKGDADGILIFTGLFAATVATFVVQTYPSLSPDTGAETVAILQHVAALLANQSQPAAASSSSAPSIPIWSGPAPSDVRVNALWFLSLIVSIIGALLATLVQQWSRQYTQDIQRRGSPASRGPIRLLLSSGIDDFHMDDALGFITSLIHVAVALFFSGLLVFLYALDDVVAWLAMGALALASLCYLSLSVLPLIYPTSPYQTPLTSPLRFAAMGFAVLSTALALLATRLVLAVQTLSHPALMNAADQFGGLQRRDSMAMALSNTFQITLTKRLQRMTRGRVSLMQESARSLGTKSICQAIDVLWQQIDEPREIADFCETIQHFITQPELRETDQEELTSFLLLEINILTRVCGLVSSLTPAPGRTSNEAETNRRLATSVRLSVSLVRRHLESGQHDGNVLQAFIALHATLITLVPEELRHHCHVSTFYLVRFLLHEMMPEVKATITMLKSATVLRRLDIPETFLQEIDYPCHTYLEQPDLRPMYGSATPKTRFLDADDYKLIFELKTARAWDCDHCRLTLLLVDIMQSSTDARPLFADYHSMIIPLLQLLDENAKRAIARNEDDSHREHPAYYLFVELLSNMSFDHAANTPIKAFTVNDPETRSGPNAYAALSFYLDWFKLSPSHRVVERIFDALIERLAHSKVAELSMDHIQRKLGYRSTPANWEMKRARGRIWFKNAITHKTTDTDIRIRPDPGERDEYGGEKASLLDHDGSTRSSIYDDIKEYDVGSAVDAPDFPQPQHG